tara:strand:- start:1866 stop:2183 length:318 start_codon:yes stop_codon:yes gene_type:complete
MKTGPDIEAQVTLISTEEGGRSGYAVSGYRPQHVFREDWVTSGAHQYITKDKLYPGESALANISFLSPLVQSLEIGTNLKIQEASRVVGFAKVTKIFNAQLGRHS